MLSTKQESWSIKLNYWSLEVVEKYYFDDTIRPRWAKADNVLARIRNGCGKFGELLPFVNQQSFALQI